MDTHRMKRRSGLGRLPTPKYFCLCSQQPMSIFSDFLPDFFSEAPPISQNEAMSKVNFSIIHLVRTVCELTFTIIQTHYTQTTLICLRLRKSFLIEDHRTLSPKTMHRVCCFRGCLLSGRSLFPWFRGFFLLFVGFVQPLITDSFKPAISEDG